MCNRTIACCLFWCQGLVIQQLVFCCTYWWCVDVTLFILSVMASVHHVVYMKCFRKRNITVACLTTRGMDIETDTFLCYMNCCLLMYIMASNEYNNSRQRLMCQISLRIFINGPQLEPPIMLYMQSDHEYRLCRCIIYQLEHFLFQTNCHISCLLLARYECP